MGRRGAYDLATAIEAVEVPTTVQSLLAARIDRLGEREKQLLYTAAVIGKEFPRPLLEAVIGMPEGDVDAALMVLLAAEMVYERAIYPVAEYAFKHPLTHESRLVAVGAPAPAERLVKETACYGRRPDPIGGHVPRSASRCAGSAMSTSARARCSSVRPMSRAMPCSVIT